jgi:phosphatidylinositol alpha-1,6-mannosyltransferase
MRLLALVTDAFGGFGGIARYNRDLMLALAQSPSVTEIVVLPRLAPGPVAGVPAKVCQVAPSAGRVAWSARALALAAQQRFDAVFCGHLYAVPVAAAIAGLRRMPLWVQVHGVDGWERRGAVDRRALRSAALVTSVSRYTRAALLSWSDLPPHRVRVLPNTVAATYAPRPRRDDLVARLGLTGRRIILTVGRLSALERYKGHDRLIGALPGIIARVPDAAYLIVGSGDEQARLEQLVRMTGVGDRVVFAGQVADPELPDYFALADVFAMPSTGEGFGIAFLEAAASGLPVIGGNSDGSVDALADGRIGRLVDPHAPAKIEGAVIDALLGRHPVLAAAEEARRFAFARFAAHVDALVGTLAG